MAAYSASRSIALNFGALAQYKITANLTVCCWANLISAPDLNYPCLISRGILNAGDSYCLYQYPVTNTVNFGVCWDTLGNRVIVQSAVGNLHGALHHFAGVRNKTAGTLQIYVDGQLSASAGMSSSYNILAGTQPLYIGNNGRPMGGLNYDSRVYNRALSAAEIADIYASKGRDSVLDSSMVLRTCILNGYTGDSLTGQTVYDHSTYKNHITASGTIAVGADPYSTVKPPVQLVLTR